MIVVEHMHKFYESKNLFENQKNGLVKDKKGQKSLIVYIWAKCMSSIGTQHV